MINELAAQKGNTHKTPDRSSILPFEILSIIFRQCKRTTTCNEDETATPIRLSSVNRFWRQVSLQNPHLWRNLFCCMASRPERLIVFLERSFPLSVDLYVHLEDERRDLSSPCNNPPTPDILPALNRCRRLTIDSESFDLVVPFLEALSRQDMLQLRELRVSMLDKAYSYSDNPESSVTEGITLTGSSPLLKTCALKDISLLACSPPLGAIENLELISPQSDCVSLEYDQFCEALKSLKSTLISLKLGGWIVFPLKGEYEEILLPSLRHLYASDERDGWDDVRGYMRHVARTIVTPSLESLTLHTMCGDSLEAFMTPLRTQKSVARYPLLKDLHLNGVDLDSQEDNIRNACPSAQMHASQ